MRTDAHGGQSIDLAWIESNLRRAVELLAHQTAEAAGSGPFLVRRASAGPAGMPREIEVRIVGDVRMRELHARHCGLDCTTDVLTFPGDADADGCLSRADIAVCRDEAARQASEAGHALEPELLLYSLHGVLHCLGYDDHEPEDYALMHDVEDRVLEAIGVGSIFRVAGTANPTEAAPPAVGSPRRGQPR